MTEIFTYTFYSTFVGKGQTKFVLANLHNKGQETQGLVHLGLKTYLEEALILALPQV